MSRLVSRSSRAGFALVTVLFGLAVITTLMSAAMVRTLAHAEGVATERKLARDAYLRAELTELAGVWAARDGADITEALTVSLGEETHTITAVPVSGLIDLNTALPPLIEAILTGFDAPPGAMQAYRGWRQRGWRLQRVEGFARVIGLGPDQYEGLHRVATVYSGRLGLSSTHLPLEVVDLLEEHLTNGGDATGQIYDDAISGNRNIYVDRWLAGIVQTSSPTERVLEVR